MDAPSSLRSRLQTGQVQQQERNDRIDWDELSTEDMRLILRGMESDIVLSNVLEVMGPENRHGFFERMARFAKEGNRERAEMRAIIERAKSLLGWGDALCQAPKLDIPQPSRETSARQNVAVVAPDVTLPDVTPKALQNRHEVTAVASDVAHHVVPYSPVVRAKRGEDGLYRCGQCGYTTGRSGTLRMHRFRKHRNPMK